MLPTIRCIGRSQLIRVGLVTPHDINGVPAYPACAMSRAELGRVLTNARKVPGTSRTPEPRNSRVITLGNPYALVVGLVLLAFLVGVIVVALLQGREISAWPPKIGPRLAPPVLSLPISPPGIDSPPEESVTSQNGHHSIHGTWLCQYKYPRLHETLGVKEPTIEVQIVELEEHGGSVRGKSLHAIAHPEFFAGSVSLGRYFTGTYKNASNTAASYHGAFQFVLSHSKARMKGRWVGFNREGNDIDTEEWRWERLDDRVNLPQHKIQEFLRANANTDLFLLEPFL